MIHRLSDINIDQPRIEALNLKKALNQAIQPIEATDIDGFMRNQYQNTIITAIEKAKEQVRFYFHHTFDRMLISFIKKTKDFQIFRTFFKT